MNYLDGIFIVLVMTLYLRSTLDFDRTLWALLWGGLLLGVLTVFQQFTGSYEQTFAGLAQVELRNIHDETSGFRSAGPVSANYFALVLVIAVPLAVDRFLREPRPALRANRGGGAGVLRSPRSSSPTLAAGSSRWLPCSFRWRPGSRRAIASGRPSSAGVAALAVAAVAAPTDYGQRLAALVQVAGLVRGDVPSESALRGRLSEVTSAAIMFVDHPVVGVGYGNFEDHYHRYARDLALDGRREERQAHSLYLEVAAETGALGVLAFAVLLAHPIAGVRRTHAALRREGQPPRCAAGGGLRDRAVRLPGRLPVPSPELSPLLLASAGHRLRAGGAQRRRPGQRLRARAGGDMSQRTRIALRRLRTRVRHAIGEQRRLLAGRAARTPGGAAGARLPALGDDADHRSARR